MVRSLPDEIIHELLSPALHVPDEEFSATVPHTAYVRPLESASAILLVSKSWLRIATPLLYNVVILRSRGQVQALELALRSRGSDLGRFIKKLRIEGGYTVALEKILAKAKNLTDIALTLELGKGENVKGICQSVRSIMDALEEYIPKWTKLTVFTMRHSPSSTDMGLPVSHNEIFARALKSAPNLRTVVLPGIESPMFEVIGHIPNYLLTLAGIPSLQEIRSDTRARRPMKPQCIRTFQKSPRLAELIDLTLLDAVPKKTFIYPPQLTADPALEDAIWDRVLSFVYATKARRPTAWYHGVVSYDRGDYDDFDGDSMDDFNEWIYRPPRRVRPLLVCKRFLRLGTPYMYGRLMTSTPEKLQTLLHKFDEQPLLGQHVRQLCLNDWAHKNRADTSRLLSHLPRLASLTAEEHDPLVLPWKLFDELSVRCGATLDTFEGLPVEKPEGNKQVDPIVFSRLVNMQFFSWESNVVFYTTKKNTDAFAKLEELMISRADVSFYTVLSRMELPALRCVIFTADKLSSSHVFFKKHGGKLEKLIISDAVFGVDILNYCPSIRVLSIVSNRHLQIRSPIETFKQCDSHPLLERIVFRALSGSVQTDEHGDKHPDKFLSTFDRTLFPSLHEIEHMLFGWNLAEAEMLKHPYVKWAEKFQKEGVELVQSPGENYRPRRLFVSRSSKRRGD
ncbi:hypothetical protein FB45DRAFT_1061967 [Roridomyces roridus]|uniref:Uncharacterized protein n=1 Tax=Roridomyces roridus TaxID=1738132 RepID=A0AAD7BJ31_9AGAR|nr:hypothetical protein FB45DRAFT_1061967 [Roridomyces roridus]